MTSFKAIVPLKIDPPSLFAVQLPGKASHRALVSLINPCPRASFTTLITLSTRLTLNITPGSSPGQWVNLANPPPSLDSLGHNSLDEPEEIAQTLHDGDQKHTQKGAANFLCIDESVIVISSFGSNSERCCQKLYPRTAQSRQYQTWCQWRRSHRAFHDR